MGGLQYAGFIVPILLGLTLLEYQVSKYKKKEVYRFSDTMVNMCCGMLERLFDLFFVVLSYFIFGFLYENVAPFYMPWEGLGIAGMVGMWIVALLWGDFLAYWHHRLSHEINMFWAAHIVHHQSEELNITTVFRVSAFAVINRLLFWIWLPIIGFSPAVATSVILFIGLFQFVTHSRLVGKLGFLEYIFVTPSHHRVHHARNDKYIDKNYGHVFIFWDKMLGTFEPETEEPEFGIITGFESSNPYWAYLYYWTTLFKRAGKAKSWKNKLKVFVMPPAWENEDVPHLPYSFEVDENGKRKKYELNLPFRLGFYTFINVLFTMGCFIYLLINHKAQGSLPTAQLTAIILISIVSFGPLMERKKWAMKADFFRLAFLAVNIPIFFWAFQYNWVFIAVFLIYTLIMFVWLMRMREYFMEKPEEQVESNRKWQVAK